MAIVKLPGSCAVSPLQNSLMVEAETLGEVVSKLLAIYPKLNQIFNPPNQIKEFVIVFVNGQSILPFDAQVKINPSDKIVFSTALSGG